MEWRTLAVAGAIYGGIASVVVGHNHLPWVVAVLLLGILLAWHGSLQHEAIHGHPFRRKWANDLLAWPPLALRLPYHVYRKSHIAHHECESLTDPFDDTESYYVDAARWHRMSRVRRWLLLAHHTLAGRMVLGPPVEIMRILSLNARTIRSGDWRLGLVWAGHVAASAAVLAVVTLMAGMPWWQYLLALYPAHSLTLVRSYLEHRFVDGDATRSAVVRSGPFFSLLFLNNNLHHTHHAEPGVPWYRLPARAATLNDTETAAGGAGAYRSYVDVFRRYLFRRFDHPVHPAQRIDGFSPAH